MPVTRWIATFVVLCCACQFAMAQCATSISGEQTVSCHSQTCSGSGLQQTVTGVGQYGAGFYCLSYSCCGQNFRIVIYPALADKWED
jgi:hypothetical protein